MTAYYPAKIHDDSYGKDVVMTGYRQPTHTAAMQKHADEIGRLTLADEQLHGGYWRRAVLLDTGSIDTTDPDALRELLLNDPLLHAIYQLGRAGAKLDLDEATSSTG